MSFLRINSLKEYPDVLDVTHVKEILMIGINLAYKLLKENKIANVKVGRKMIVSKSSVIKYLNQLHAAKEEQNDEPKIS